MSPAHILQIQNSGVAAKPQRSQTGWCLGASPPQHLLLPAERASAAAGSEETNNPWHTEVKGGGVSRGVSEDEAAEAGSGCVQERRGS